MYFPCPKEINLCFSTWKVLVISSVGVVTAYKIHLRTSLLLLQFCCSHYIIDTFEKAPQDIILQFFYSSQVLPTPGTSNELFYISSRVVCAAKVLLLSQIKLCNFKIRSVMWGFFLLLSWFCWGFFFNEENGLRQAFLVVQNTFSVEQDGFIQTQVGTGSTAGILGILAMHHYLRFLTNSTAANSLCL